MRRIAQWSFALLCLLQVAAAALGQTTQITASNIAYFGGRTVTGTFCLTPTDQSGNPINIVTPMGQQVSPQAPLCFPITSGVLSSLAIVPDTSQTQPANACYKLVINNAFGSAVATFPCIQPQGSTWSFDAYIPNGTIANPAFTLPQFQVNGVPNPLQSIVNFVGLGVSYGAGGAININTGGVTTIASGTAAMPTTLIASGTCSIRTVTATGAQTTDVISSSPNTDPTAVSGYAPSLSGSLYIWYYLTSGNANFKVCNPTLGDITPSPLTLNWRVAR